MKLCNLGTATKEKQRGSSNPSVPRFRARDVPIFHQAQKFRGGNDNDCRRKLVGATNPSKWNCHRACRQKTKDFQFGKLRDQRRSGGAKSYLNPNNPGRDRALIHPHPPTTDTDGSFPALHDPRVTRYRSTYFLNTHALYQRDLV